MSNISITYRRNGDAEVRFNYDAALVASFKRVVAGPGNKHARWTGGVWVVEKTRVQTLISWSASVQFGTAITDADRKPAKKKTPAKKSALTLARYRDEDDLASAGLAPTERWYRLMGDAR